VRSALVLLVLASCAGSGGAESASSAATDGTAKAGHVASDFTTRDIDGKTLRLSDHLGKEVVLLDFWSTFCQPCQAEIPHLRRLYEQHKAQGFVVIAVSMDGPETVAEVPSFARRNQMTFPVVLDEDSRIASMYNPRKSAPLSVLIDKQGKVVAVREGYNPGDEEFLAKDVARAMSGGLDSPAPPK